MLFLWGRCVYIALTGHIVNYYVPVAHFPRKDARVLHTVGLDPTLDVRMEARLRPRPAQHSGSDAARLLVAVEDLGDAAVGHAQLARDDARTDAGRRQFDDLQTDVVGQRTAIDEHSAQLIHAPLTCCTIFSQTKNFKITAG